jgi:hypothetical protein
VGLSAGLQGLQLSLAAELHLSVMLGLPLLMNPGPPTWPLQLALLLLLLLLVALPLVNVAVLLLLLFCMLLLVLLTLNRLPPFPSLHNSTS